MARRLLKFVMLLPLLLGSGRLHAATVSATARLAVGGLETQPGGAWDSGNLTVTFNGFSATVHYAQFSTPESLAAGLAAELTRDYVYLGLYAKAGAPGTGLDVVTLQLTNGQQFGCIEDTGPTSSFNLSPSGFASSCSPGTDSGTVTLSVNGSVVSSTHYGAGSTPATVADGLASMASSGTVTVKADGGLVYVTSSMQGSGTDYPYAVSVVDDTAGVTPTVSATPMSGSLTGGSNGGPGGAPGTVYSYGITYDGASNVQTMTDLGTGNQPVMGSWTYGYDTLNRLTSAVSTSGPYVTGQTPYLCWSYDSYGNRTHQTLSNMQLANGATCQAAGGATLQDTAVTYSASAPNRIAYSMLPGVSGKVTPQYDDAGNVTNDGVNTTYLYDAEGRVCAVHGVYGMTGYQYDASGERVGKGTITTMSCDVTTNGYQPTNDYVLGQGNEQVTEVAIQNGVPSWQHTNVMADGMLVATYDTVGWHFYLNDPLGSRRAQTDSAGQWEQNCLSLPYGDQLSCTMSIPAPTEHHFTGKERDTESGLDYFGARYFNSAFGRWMSPDWAAKAEPVPYAKLDDPQSLNLYGYLGNNPLEGSDPDGHVAPNSHCNGGCPHVTPRQVARYIKDTLVGGIKGLGQLAWSVATTGYDSISPTMEPTPVNLQYSNTDQAVGGFIAPLLIPGLGEESAAVDSAGIIQRLATNAIETAPEGANATVRGTLAHTAFANTIRALDNPNISAEVSYLGGVEVKYGTPGSVRLDAVVGPRSAPTAAYDLKTGAAGLTSSRVAKIRANLPAGSRDIPIYEVRK